MAWPQLEPARGRWEFALLDRYVRLVAQKHVEILLTLGLTPAWASARPNETSAYQPGNAAEPRDLEEWENYVRVVATRYKGVIHSYEVWNEPNIRGTFSGSEDKMLELSQIAYKVLKSIDPTITVVSPSATTGSGLRWLEYFLKSGGCRYIDVVGYHFYVTPGPPEAMVPLIRQVEHIARSHSCGDKPLWNTESGWTSPKQFSSDAEAASYVMRTYLLNWVMGVERCYWYAWDNHNWSTLDLTSRTDGRITSAGVAYDIVHKWMQDAVLSSCSRQHSGLWICEVRREGSTNEILWSDGRSQRFSVPATWHVQQTSNWKGEVTKPSVEVTVDGTPLLLVGN